MGPTHEGGGELNAGLPPHIWPPCRLGPPPGLTTPRPGPGGHQLLGAGAWHCRGLPTTLFASWSCHQDCWRTGAHQPTSGLAPGCHQLSGTKDTDEGNPHSGCKERNPRGPWHRAGMGGMLPWDVAEHGEGQRCLGEGGRTLWHQPPSFWRLRLWCLTLSLLSRVNFIRIKHYDPINYLR